MTDYEISRRVIDDPIVEPSEEMRQRMNAYFDEFVAKALLGPVGKQRQTALRVRGASFEIVELTDAGVVIEPCCYGTVLHAPNCKMWCA